MYHILFIHSSVGHSGCLHILAIVNSTAVNTELHISFWIMVFSGYMPRSGISGLFGNCLLSFLKIMLFIYWIYFWLCCVFIAAWTFSSCGKWGLLFSCCVQASPCSGFSCCRVWALGHVDFSGCSMWAQRMQLQGLEHRLSSCDAWAYLLHSMWDHPGPGIEAVSLALAGRFLTTEPPLKPLILNPLIHWWRIHFSGFWFWLLCVYRSLKNLFTPLFHFFNIVGKFLQYLGYLKSR